MPSASLGCTSKSAGGSDPGPFQNIVYSLGPRVCEILCAPFESGVSISYSSLALLKVKVSPTGLPSPVFWECFILVLVPKLGGSVWVHRLHSLGRASAVIIILYMWIICPGVLVLIILCLLHSHTSCCGFLFIYFVVEDLFC